MFAVDADIYGHAVREHRLASCDAPTGAQHRDAGRPLVAQPEAVNALVAILDASHDGTHAEAQAELRSAPTACTFSRCRGSPAVPSLDCVDQRIECLVERYGAAVQSACAHARGTAGQQRDCGQLSAFTDAQQFGQHEMHGSVAAVDAEQFDSVVEQRAHRRRKVGERSGFDVAHVAQTF